MKVNIQKISLDMLGAILPVISYLGQSTTNSTMAEILIEGVTIDVSSGKEGAVDSVLEPLVSMGAKITKTEESECQIKITQ